MVNSANIQITCEKTKLRKQFVDKKELEHWGNLWSKVVRCSAKWKNLGSENLLREWCSSGADMKKAWMDSTLMYIPFRLLIEASLMRRYLNKYNLWSKGDRLGLDMKIARMGHTLVYFPFWLLIERSRMTPFHHKFSSSWHHNSG